MYPNLYYFLRDTLGIEWDWTKFINSFGFFVALAFIAAAVVLTNELKRKERLGLLQPKEEKRVVGKPATFAELFFNAIIGFLLGYKIIGAFIGAGDTGMNPQEYIFSSQGSWTAGILLAVIFAGLRWYDKHKQKIDKPEERLIRIWPHERVGDMVILAAVLGFTGAKIFHNLENIDEFLADPAGSLFSFSGLTFYGGLILAAIGIIWFCRKKNIPVLHLTDSIAPALMLAYGVGRIGCHVAGDGDWGIANTKPNPFSWLPDWFWSYNYPHNVLNTGVPIPGCAGEYCSMLQPPVYPTPLYEAIVCILLFVVLMLLRRRIRLAGGLFAVYLIFNGIERFFIETIRINTKYHFWGIEPTQAEIISLLLVLAGVGLLIFLKRKAGKVIPES